MNWSLFFGELVSGLTLGSIYALIALGYTMVYGILKLLNFAHGDVYMVGAFVGFFVLKWLGGPLAPAVTGWLAVAIMFTVAMLACGALGVGIERFAYRPLRNAPRIAPLISALGVSIFLQNSALLLWGPQFRDYDTFDLVGVKSYHIGTNFFISNVQILTISVSIGLTILLALVISRTRTGKAMRATSFDRDAAEMMGISIDRVISFTFFLGSALAAAGGIMFGLVFGQIFSLMGFTAGLKGFTAAVVGGIGSIPGAVLGGFLIGLTEAFATGYLPGGSVYANLYVFALLIVMFLIRPTGLLGSPVIQKV
ncbi:MAG: branched-chain amino acid ABC transporter permease [Actinobacteria bacterium]|nr:MAG: branched-chain amino acid ABC transporter permease [Actinomycetota bacterium]